jgi:gamma-glutamylcyclotransferase (GGCT)/AIG2-like uncharacterized protein YtfP
MTTDSITSLFVYGTLKTGQCREKCWPATPLGIRKAWLIGELYDTGPYPALLGGQDCVAGELWTFEPSDMPRVLSVLDRIEEYRPGCEATNLYNRVIERCWLMTGGCESAYCYRYGQPGHANQFQRVEPSYEWEGRRFAVWPTGGRW